MGRFAPITEAAAEQVAESALAGASVREHVEVDIPGTTVKGMMRVLSREEQLLLKADALKAFREQGLVNRDGSIAAAAQDDWKCEIAVRHLAAAVRNPENLQEQLAPIGDWRTELTDEQIAGPWDKYQDLRDRLDPLGDDSIVNLTANDIAIIHAAAKKKDAVLLRSFGLHKLALYAITSADPPAS